MLARPTTLANAAFLCLLAGITSAQAQVVLPGTLDPGALQRQEMERRQQQPARAAEPEPGVIRDTPSVIPAEPQGGASFVVRELRFGGSAFLAPEELKGIADRYVGREIDFAGLSRLVADVNAVFQQRGLITARAVLAPQRIVDGIVQIDLVEARLGRVVVEGLRQTRENYASDWISEGLKQPLDLQEVEQRIQRFNRGHPSRMEANLRPGASFGLTDLLLTLHEPEPFTLRAFANNEGSDSVGRELAGLDGALNGTAGIGDRIGVYLGKSRGTGSAMLSYAVPVNRWGGRLSASFTKSNTEVVAGPFRALGISGSARSTQIALVQPLLQRAGWWFDAAASLGTSHSQNQIGGVPLSDATTLNRSLGAVASGSFEDRNLNLSITATRASTSTSIGAGRDFNLRQVNASWVENFGKSQFGVLRLSAQDTGDTVLTPSLLFQLGGSNSIRGYQVGALAGDRGFHANLEFHRMLTSGLDGFVFHDFGEVRTQGLPHQSARSAGAGLDWQFDPSGRANLTLGRTLKTVLLDQRDWRVTARISWDFR